MACSRQILLTMLSQQVGSWCGVRSDAGWTLANGGLALQRVQRPFASGPSMGDMTLQPVGPQGATVSFATEDDPGGWGSCEGALYAQQTPVQT